MKTTVNTENVASLQRLARMTNVWTSMSVILAIVLLLIAGIAYFTGANSNITQLMNGVSIAAMALVLVNAMVLFSVYWYRNTSSMGLDGYLVVGLLQNRAGQALIVTLLIFVACFQIYTTARSTPVG